MDPAARSPTASPPSQAMEPAAQAAETLQPWQQARMHTLPADTQAPPPDDAELWRRERPLLDACRLLLHLPKPLHLLRVLDVGCGAGLGTRLLVDLGVVPSNIVAIDMRPAALEQARSSHPAIDWRLVRGLKDWPEGPFDLVVQYGVFSTLPSDSVRRTIARCMEQAAGNAGHILWWDKHHADSAAGCAALDPRPLFAQRPLLQFNLVAPGPQQRELPQPATTAPAARGHRRTHCEALFGPRAAHLPAPPQALAQAPAPPAHTESGGTPSPGRLCRMSAADIGLALGAWEVFQHRPLLEIYARHYRHRVIDVDGVLAVVKHLPGLGPLRAQVYSPEANAGASWSQRLSDLPVGELVVMSNQPAQGHWPAPVDPDLVSLVIDLRGRPDALFSRFEKRARSANRKGERAGMEILPSDDGDDLAAFHAVLMRLSVGGSRFPVPPLTLLSALLSARHATLYLARMGGLILGGCVVLRHRYTHALVSCFDSQACGGLPSTNLYVQTMLHEQAHGIPFLDLGPHNVQTQAGLFHAKRAFSPLIVPAYRYTRPGAGWRPWLLAAGRQARRLTGRG